ncbi:MAG: anti-sigma factor antagonist [Firmicutes bacterium]|nr:anti-sigma factor antagonist [Bacillota bacterium]
MKVEHKLIRSTLYIGLSGELDSSNADYVRGKMDELIENSIDRLVVDLSMLDFMDSTGVGVLLGRYKRLRAKSVPIFLASPQKGVDKVLTLSGVYDIMPKISN